jgi:hypothetical protein
MLMSSEKSNEKRDRLRASGGGDGGDGGTGDFGLFDCESRDCRFVP